jgi:hypothetical protein
MEMTSVHSTWFRVRMVGFLASVALVGCAGRNDPVVSARAGANKSKDLQQCLIVAVEQAKKTSASANEAQAAIDSHFKVSHCRDFAKSLQFQSALLPSGEIVTQVQAQSSSTGEQVQVQTRFKIDSERQRQIKDSEQQMLLQKSEAERRETTDKCCECRKSSATCPAFCPQQIQCPGDPATKAQHFQQNY